MLGIADVDTRAITRALRTTGCLNGVITTDASVSDADLVARTKEWSILGKDLISEVPPRPRPRHRPPRQSACQLSAEWSAILLRFSIREDTLGLLYTECKVGCDP